MGKTLVLAEKPSVARDIARVLQCTKKGEGCYFNDTYVVTWAIGHLITLCDPEEYAPELKKWDSRTLPILPEQMKLTAIKKTAPQLKILKKLMNGKDISHIICATDSGREGELIFRYIYQYIKCKKPFSRLWISSMTTEAIKDGFLHLKDGTEMEQLYLSAKCRSEADWLVGINATRAFTLQYHVLLSVGRVQTPTLSIIVKRQQEIADFIPKDYYEVQADFGVYQGIWFHKKETQTKIEKKEQADAIAAKTNGQPGKIESIRQEEKKQPPPLLYDLTELQRDCNKKFGFSAQKTLSVVQDLYEKRKMVTYPRTDSRYLSHDMVQKVKAAIQALSAVTAYQKPTAYIASLKALPVTKRVFDDKKVSDHHAIIPTDGKMKVETLTAEEKKVFHLIALRFFAVFYPPYVCGITKVVTRVKEEPFFSKGVVVLSYGWMELYQKFSVPQEEKGEALKQLPEDITEGMEMTASKVEVVKKQTQPPKPYTEATLLSAMEHAGRFVEEESLKEQLKESGLGTPATRAAIIERLLTVGYITRKGKQLLPTEKGVSLIAVVPEQLKSPETTGKWEKGLASIAKGKMAEDRFMESIRRFVRFLVAEGRSASQDVVFQREEADKGKKGGKSFGTCPACKGRILENSKAFYCSNWQNGCRFTIWKNTLDSYGCPLTGEIVRKLLKQGKAEGLPVTLPQTGEKRMADLFFKKDANGMVELRNMEKLPETASKKV